MGIYSPFLSEINDNLQVIRIDGVKALQNVLGDVITAGEWEDLKIAVDMFYADKTDSDIKAMNEYLKNRRNHARSNSDKNKDHSGYVYFLKADNGLTKIGRSKELTKRIHTFTAKLPYELELVQSFKTNNSKYWEEYFHDLFKEHRQRGEWFDLTDTQIQSVKGIFENEHHPG